MDVQLTPEVQAKLDQLSGETGRGREEFVCDALAGYLDELAQIRDGKLGLVPARNVEGGDAGL